MKYESIITCQKKKKSQNNGKQAPKYYDQLWGKFNDALKEEETAVPANQCAGTPILVAVAKLVELGCKLLSHPPYSPDLAPSDFFLFPNMKK
jgi:hypothetical protein